MVVVRDALLPTYLPTCLPTYNIPASLPSFNAKTEAKSSCDRWVMYVVMFCIEALLAWESGAMDFFSVWYLEFDEGVRM